METIFSESAPNPIGPYSQAIEVGGFLFCSGQIALDPATGEMHAGSIEEETEQVLRNLAAVLRAAGLNFTNVAKTTIFLTDLGDFVAVNGIYERMIAPAKPARSTVEVRKLPRGARVEIEAIARMA